MKSFSSGLIWLGWATVKRYPTLIMSTPMQCPTFSWWLDTRWLLQTGLERTEAPRSPFSVHSIHPPSSWRRVLPERRRNQYPFISSPSVHWNHCNTSISCFWITSVIKFRIHWIPQQVLRTWSYSDMIFVSPNSVFLCLSSSFSSRQISSSSVSWLML